MPYTVGTLLLDLNGIFGTALPTLSGVLNAPGLGPPSTATAAAGTTTLTFGPPPNPPGAPGTLLVTDTSGAGDFYRSGPISRWPAQPVFVNAVVIRRPLPATMLTGAVTLPLVINVPAGIGFLIGLATGFSFAPFRITITRLVIGGRPSTGGLRANLSGTINFMSWIIPRRTTFTGSIDVLLTPSGDAADPEHVYDLTGRNLALSIDSITPLLVAAVGLLAPLFSNVILEPIRGRVRDAFAGMVEEARKLAASGAGLNLFSPKATINLRRVSAIGAGLIVDGVLSELQDAPAIREMTLIAAAPLSDGRLEAWATPATGGLMSTWKESTHPDSGWAPWEDVIAQIGALPAAVRDIAMIPLSDGRIISWVTTTNGALRVSWKTTTDSNSAWAPWVDFLGEVGSLPSPVRQVALGRLPDGRLENFVVTDNGQVFTTWQVTTDPDSAWAPWADFLGEVGALPSGATQIAVAPLPDGRLELWAVTAAGGLQVTRKVTSDPNANWSPWADFTLTRPELPAPVRQVAMAPLQDGRIESWAVLTTGQVFSTWKSTTDPNSPWAPWQDFLAEVGQLPAPVQSITVAPRSDGRLVVWAVTTAGGVYLTMKANADTNGPWTVWSNFLLEP